MKILHKTAHILLIIGGLNWLLIGLFKTDIVAYLGNVLASIVYVLVGLAAVYDLITIGDCGRCAGKNEHQTTTSM